MNSLDDLLDVAVEGPEVRRARALVQADKDFLRKLVAMRKALRLSQEDVARLLGITQPSVAAFERYDSDPKLSTIRRYAQAVGALVYHHVEPDHGQLSAEAWPPACDSGWHQLPTYSFQPSVAQSSGLVCQVAADAPSQAALALAA